MKFVGRTHIALRRRSSISISWMLVANAAEVSIMPHGSACATVAPPAKSGTKWTAYRSRQSRAKYSLHIILDRDYSKGVLKVSMNPPPDISSSSTARIDFLNDMFHGKQIAEMEVLLWQRTV